MVHTDKLDSFLIFAILVSIFAILVSILSGLLYI